MRKILLSLSLALFAFSLKAEVVDQHAALMAARNFVAGSAAKMGTGTPSSGKTLELEATSLDFSASASFSLAAPSPTYYIYNISDGGFVIVSGDDCLKQILAYSDTGRIDSGNMAPELLFWMSCLDREVKEVRLAGVQERDSSWDSAMPRGAKSVSLETADWDQSTPFNNLCPVMDGRKALTGCVATAAAIVCRYYRWPESGTGTLPSYTYDRGDGRGRYTVKSVTLGREYDYTLMPLRYTSGYTSSEATAVAQLMSDLGVGCKMMYDYDGSGAYTHDLLNTLVENFGYNPEAQLLSRGNFPQTQWENFLIEDLDEGRPIIYGGSTKQGEGHQFVFDGYDSNRYFHVNWGWGGSGNGYFTISELGNHSTVGYVFSEYQDAILHLFPNGSPAPVKHSADEIAAKTELVYFKADNSIKITPGFTIDYKLEGPSGFETVEDIAQKGVALTLKFPADIKGTYTLSLSANDDPYVLIFKL